MLVRQFKRSEGKDKPLQVKLARPTPVIVSRKRCSKPVKVRTSTQSGAAPYPGCVPPEGWPRQRLIRPVLVSRRDGRRSACRSEGPSPAVPRPFAPMNVDSDSDESMTGERPRNEQGEELFCLCRKPYNPRIFMIGCDSCDDWFHGKCVRIPANVAKTLEKYVCPRCVKKQNRAAKRAAESEDVDMTPAKQVVESSSVESTPESVTPRVEPRTPELTKVGEKPDEKSHDDPPSSLRRQPSDSSLPCASVPSSSERHESDSFNSSPSQIHSPPHDFTPDPRASITLEGDAAKLPKCGNPECASAVTDSMSKFCGETCAVEVSKANLKRRQELLLSPSACLPQAPPSRVPLRPFVMDQSTKAADAPVDQLTKLRKEQADVRCELNALDGQIAEFQTTTPSPVCGFPLVEAGTTCSASAECSLHADWRVQKLSDLRQERALREKTLRRLQIEETLAASSHITSPLTH